MYNNNNFHLMNFNQNLMGFKKKKEKENKKKVYFY